MSTKYDREPGIEALLNAARDAAIHAFDGMPATKANLAGMRDVAVTTIRAQAETGMWREWCVTSAADLGDVRCIVELRATLGIQSPIAIHWDFSRTPLRHLVAETAPVHTRGKA